jgi:hypothetical protein
MNFAGIHANCSRRAIKADWHWTTRVLSLVGAQQRHRTLAKNLNLFLLYPPCPRKLASLEITSDVVDKRHQIVTWWPST